MAFAAHIPLVLKAHLFQIAFKRKRLAAQFPTHESLRPVLGNPSNDLSPPLKNVTPHRGNTFVKVY